ncbi:hypothetical protein [Kineococcus rhizosphaerae]|uniref:Uncharacterized protein n=1 Tax=Kineococcus rhizosphaerae TaxID=559628 RepID=A0A2T0R4U1_9ACTN|nr:hypothetical protein [Kineococcus rhizosphaerae]PRY15373.1 hypothetical protein CLV37_105301 [Kineococcus rhizosphaerae]
MSRSVLGLDRVLAVLAALLLIVAGAATAAWGAGELDRVWAASPQRLNLQTASDVLATAWWPWVAGLVGVVLAVLAVWWLLAHIPRRGVPSLPLPGTARTGRLSIAPDAPVEVAADVLAETPGIRSARGRVLRDRGRLVVALDATVEPDADLLDVVAATDTVSAQLAEVLGRDDARARVRLRVARHARHQTRVH